MATSRPHPLEFEGHVGWLHLPDASQRRNTGILICAPPGRDGRCAHRSLLILAQKLEQAGFPVLRFDLLGVGESLDLRDDKDLWDHWLRGIGVAAATLRAQAHLDQTAVVGLRLGASLAVLAETNCQAAVLMAPIISGRRYIRELKLAAAMSGTAGPEASPGLESEGLLLNPATLEQLSALNLKELENWPPRLLVTTSVSGRGDLSSGPQGEGIESSEIDFPGYEDLFQDTHSNRAPDLLFSQITDWLTTQFPETAPGNVRAEPPLPTLHPTGAIERSVWFGSGLNGTLCQPTALASRSRIVIFCSTSAEPRAGVGRFAVTTARALALCGIASLRFDFAGVGESDGPEGRHVYETSRAADFRETIDFVSGQGFEEITLVGVCSGAFHVLVALSDDPRVHAAFVVSPKLVWRRGESLVPEKRDQGRATGVYIQGIKNPATWLRLLRGRVDVRAVLKTLTRRVVARWGAKLQDKAGKDLRERLRQTSARGARLHVLTGLDDATFDEIETYLGGDGKALTRLPGMSLWVEPDLDHGLARSTSRALAQAQLIAFLERR